ncbi:MAG TPA: hypothetical protein VM388_09900 [Acidimicrobiales bacterium]|nr:hypothetical protein [Acidimicrobiales bacterium]
MDQTTAPHFEASCAYAQVGRAAFPTCPPEIPGVVPGERLAPALVAHRIQVVCE